MRRHEPSYDGLRALAVIMVVGFHCSVPLFGGGALGVDVFFVLSGFLITRILVDELEASGRIRIGAFVYRRWSRLGPAAMITVGVVALISAVRTVDPAHAVGPKDFFGVATYSTNWLVAFGAFTTHPASLLTHFWSLAMEEQFYLVWPFLLLSLWKLRGRNAAIVGMAVVVITGCIWRSAVGASGATELRLGFGGDTHGPDALALGGLLAMWSGEARWRVGALGVAILTLLVAYPGGSLPLSSRYSIAELAAVLIVGCAPALRPLAVRPAVAVGRVSYGVYLWHTPVLFVFIRPLHWLSGFEFAATLVVSLAIATASHRLVERPVRRLLLARAGRHSSAVKKLVECTT